MGWTYAGDPSANDRDFVRFEVGDTDTTDQLVTDEEIAGAVSVWGNKWRAASNVAKAIAGKFARRVDTTMGKLKISYSQRVKHYMDLAKTLEAEAKKHGAAAPWAGAISQDLKKAEEDDSDRVQPAFVVDQFDFPPTSHVDNQIST